MYICNSGFNKRRIKKRSKIKNAIWFAVIFAAVGGVALLIRSMASTPVNVEFTNQILIKIKPEYIGQYGEKGANNSKTSIRALDTLNEKIKPKKISKIANKIHRDKSGDIDRWVVIDLDEKPSMFKKGDKESAIAKRTLGALADYKNSPAVEVAEINSVAKAAASTLVPNDSLYSQQWAHKKTRVEEAWYITQGSPNVKIAIIDSGVGMTHPDINNNVFVNNDKMFDGIDNDNNGYVDDTFGWNFASDGARNDISDKFWHGTFVAGVAAAVSNNSRDVAGVCWKCKILPVRFLNSDGVGYTSGLVRSIKYAVDNGANIINISWGTGEYSYALKDAIEYAYDNNVVTVAAQGNSGGTSAEYGYAYPASYDHVIAVGASNNNNELATISSHNENMDILAPGENILSTWCDNSSCYDDGTGTGTSFSAPYVAGVVGLLRSYMPTYRVDRIIQAIRNGAKDLFTAGYDANSGFGLIDAKHSLSILTSPVLMPVISSPSTPANIMKITGTFDIKGNIIATPDTSLKSWILEYGDATTKHVPSTWIRINSGITTPSVPGTLLGRLDVTKLAVRKRYTLRLTAYSSSGQKTYAEVHLVCRTDDPLVACTDK